MDHHSALLLLCGGCNHQSKAMTAQLLLQPHLQDNLERCQLLLAAALWSCTTVLEQALQTVLSRV